MKNKIKQILKDYFQGQVNDEEYENVLAEEEEIIKPEVYTVDEEDIDNLAELIEKEIRKEG